MREVKHIEIVLENCEAIKFEQKDIKVFDLANIKRNISRVASNSIAETVCADEVFIQIISSANDCRAYTTTWSGCDTKPFQRINQYDDITSILITYEDGSRERIYVDWKGISDYINENQSTKVSEKTGDLYIVISEKETVDSFPPEWSIYEE